MRLTVNLDLISVTLFNIEGSFKVDFWMKQPDINDFKTLARGVRN